MRCAAGGSLGTPPAFGRVLAVRFGERTAIHSPKCRSILASSSAWLIGLVT